VNDSGDGWATTVEWMVVVDDADDRHLKRTKKCLCRGGLNPLLTQPASGLHTKTRALL